MATRNVTVRLSLDEADAAMLGLRQLGATGQQALERIERAARPASRGLLAMDAASREAQSAMQGFASRAGGIGSVLSALGPAGLVAAAGIGAVLLALRALVRGARDAIAQLDELGKLARQTGVDVENLQGLQFAADQEGVEVEALNSSLERLTRRVGEAREGTGELASVAGEFGVRLGSTEEALADVADAIANAEDESEAARIAMAAFGREGLTMTRIFREGGAAAIERYTEELREMGGVVERETIAHAEELQSELGQLSTVIDANLNSALVSIGPVIVWVTGLVADLVMFVRDSIEAIGSFAEGVDELLRLTPLERNAANIATVIDGMNEQLAQIDEQLARLADFGGGGSPQVRVLEARRDALIRERDALARELAEMGGAPPPESEGEGEALSPRRLPALGGTGLTRQAIDEGPLAERPGAQAARRSGRTAREPRDPVAEIRRELYWLEQLRAAMSVDAEQVALVTAAREAEALAQRANIDLASEQGRELTRLVVQRNAERQSLEDYEEAQRDAAEEIERAAERQEASAQRVGDAFTDSFRRAIFQGERFLELLANLALRLADLAFQRSVFPIVGRALGDLIPGVGAEVAHTGGVLGRTALPRRMIPRAAIRDAPRMHGGGIIGADERLVIGQVGEEVLTPSNPRHIANAGNMLSPTFHLQIVLQGAANQNPAEARANGEIAGREAQRQLQAWWDDQVRRARRPGGILNSKMTV